MVATGLLCYLSGLIDISIANFGTSQAAAYVGISNVFLLTLFIMAAGPGSGGHVNPTITFATMVTGHTGFSRGRLKHTQGKQGCIEKLIEPLGILYLVGQTIGAAVAGGILRGVFGHERSIE